MAEPIYKDFTPTQFADFLGQYPVDQYDRRTGVVWLKDGNGMVQCVDDVDLRNHQAGGPDTVRVVFAERGVDAVAALDAYRKARDEKLRS